MADMPEMSDMADMAPMQIGSSSDRRPGAGTKARWFCGGIGIIVVLGVLLFSNLEDWAVSAFGRTASAEHRSAEAEFTAQSEAHEDPKGVYGFTLSCPAPLETPPTQCSGPPACLKDGCKQILVTGGSGFIGSHTVLELLNAGYMVTIVDDFANSSPESIARVRKFTNKPDMARLVFGDIRDKKSLSRVFDTCGKFYAVIHFAGLKAVGESVKKPLAYYENNVDGTVNLMQLMSKHS